MKLHIVCEQSKEEGKGKESIQLSNTHEPGHSMVLEGDKNDKKTLHTREPRGQSLSQQVTTRLQEIDMTGKTH